MYESKEYSRNNAKLRGFATEYRLSCGIDDINKVYNKYSHNKFIAMWNCKKIMHRDNGFDFRIISHNCQTFTAGYQFVDKDTGVCMIAFITPNHIYRTDSCNVLKIAGAF